MNIDKKYVAEHLGQPELDTYQMQGREKESMEREVQLVHFGLVGRPWMRMSDEERIETVRLFETTMSRAQGRSEASLVVSSESTGFGAYDMAQDAIVIPKEMVEKQDPREMLFCLFLNQRRALQCASVQLSQDQEKMAKHGHDFQTAATTKLHDAVRDLWHRRTVEMNHGPERTMESVEAIRRDPWIQDAVRDAATRIEEFDRLSVEVGKAQAEQARRSAEAAKRPYTEINENVMRRIVELQKEMEKEDEREV